MYKILVVDDSVFMRKIISDLINSDPEFDVVATARNGNEAINKTRIYNPDVITLDIEMPVMNGLEALYTIMKQFPRPVIILSAYSQREAESTFKAMELGAVDFVPKPSGEISLDLNTIKDEILTKLRSAVKAKLISNRPVINSSTLDYIPSTTRTQKDNFIRKVIVIASSTGGPRALVSLVSNLPVTLDAPVLIVQHMQGGFTKSFADRLNSLSVLPVKEAEDNEIIQNGQVYVAPGDFHMTLQADKSSQFPLYRIQIDERPKALGVRPNANYLFESVVNIFAAKTLGVVLTGMGSDGAKGSRMIHEAGGKVIAEHEDTAIVYGMPRKAAPYADKIKKLQEIPNQILKFLNEID